MLPEDCRAALRHAWRPEAAERSMERWVQVREQEQWGAIPSDLDTLAGIFGASWFFTRFLFYSGTRAAAVVDSPREIGGSVAELAGTLGAAVGAHDLELEAALEALRLERNEAMLSVLVRWLRGDMVQADAEVALTRLAEAVLHVCMDLFGLSPEHLGEDFAVLGMGRLAGGEMTFGSDLDLIFLLPGEGGPESAESGRRVRKFLRHVAAASPMGTLYEVDMRLRPHGTAGALVTSQRSFLEYHLAQRETWERQMMTRCRPVYDPAGIGAAALDVIRPRVFASYDQGVLRRDILEMRMRVERELGRRSGRFELKRGHGGIMDVDFICHYLQLAHGFQVPTLRDSATRRILAVASAHGLLPGPAGDQLRSGYEFLRRVETCLRLYDLKNVSAITLDEQACEPLARAMDVDGAAGLRAALDEVTGGIRRVLEDVLGDADGKT